MPFRGEGRKRILLVGEAPGSTEDLMNEQFVGKSGKRLRYELKQFGIDINRDCWKTNAVRCHPEENKTPNSKTIAFCRPALFREIRQLQPENILLFGSVSTESVLHHLWGSGRSIDLTSWLGWIIPCQELNAWISVHYHPSYLERQSDPLLDRLFRKDLEAVLKKKGRPWKQVPNFADTVERLYKSSSVIKALRDMKGEVAFDYETNCLKPEYHGGQIISCAISNGDRTYAFPLMGEMMDAMSAFLKGEVKKIGANIKFEDRWTRWVFKHPVRNWSWDTMLAAHVLNNNQGVSGLKFQAFVQFGQASYDRHIEPWLKVGQGYLNRIGEIPIKDLLLYNGIDAKLTFELAKKQRSMLKQGDKR